MTEPAPAEIIAVAERKLAEALQSLAHAEKKAAAEGTLTSPDEVNRLSREVGWRLHALRILKGEERNAEE